MLFLVWGQLDWLWWSWWWLICRMSGWIIAQSWCCYFVFEVQIVTWLCDLSDFDCFYYIFVTCLFDLSEQDFNFKLILFRLLLCDHNKLGRIIRNNLTLVSEFGYQIRPADSVWLQIKYLFLKLNMVFFSHLMDIFHVFY